MEDMLFHTPDSQQDGIDSASPSSVSLCHQSVFSLRLLPLCLSPVWLFFSNM
ncbi:hypothetical protein PAMP_021743 [Pampus punctatissimus]